MTRFRSRLLPLSLAVALVAVGLWIVAVQSPAGTTGDWRVWTLIMAGFVAAELPQLHVELHRQTLSISLSEIPLVLGLFILAPVPLLAARLVGTSLVSLHRRTAPAKALFNLAAFTLGTAVAEVLFRVASGGAVTGPRAWLAVYVAVSGSEQVITLLVALAIAMLLGGLSRLDLRESMATALVSTFINTTLALLGLVVARREPAALVLVAVLALALALAYRAYSVLLRRHRTLDLMHQFTAAVRGADDLNSMVPEVLRQARALLSADRAAIVLIDDDSAQCWLFRNDGPPVPTTADPLVTEVMSGRQSMLVPRAPTERRLADWLAAWKFRDAVLTPLSDGDRTVGALIVGDRLGEMATFSPGDLQLLETVAAHAGVALLGVRLVERLRHEARHDALTGLPNRRLFTEALTQAVADGSPGVRSAVLLLDLDGFKDVNETLGHHNGDLLLREVAARLRSAVPPSVTVARLGGDEFVLLVPGEQDRQNGLPVAALLRRVLRRPFSIDGIPLEIRASMGVALFPEQGADAAVLLQRADVAMYAAKQAHRAVQVYEPRLDRSSPRRLTLAGELRTATEAGQLECFYQPKVSLTDRTVVGFEALVRWRHPTMGLVVPDDFISIAEQTGLIVPLTSVVLRAAVTQCATWLAAGQELEVAVNVTPRGLLAAEFPAEVARVLRETGLPPALLTLELTESSVMSDPVGTTAVLMQLHELGVKLSVDDFGTGYSSLSYLQRLPVDEVKIDMSFVRGLATDPDNAAIVRAIIELGHALRLSVVAEGVEDQRSLDMLTAYHCDIAQGYLVSRPLPAAVATTWLAEVSAWGKPVPARPRLIIAR